MEEDIRASNANLAKIADHRTIASITDLEVYQATVGEDGYVDNYPSIGPCSKCAFIRSSLTNWIYLLVISKLEWPSML